MKVSINPPSGLALASYIARLIASTVADGAQSLIREQVEMGVAVRMAVLQALAQHLPNA